MALAEGDPELERVLGREATAREVAILGFLGFAIEATVEGNEVRGSTMVSMLATLDVSDSEIQQGTEDLQKVVNEGWGPVPAGTEFVMAKQSDIDEAGSEDAYVEKVVRPGAKTIKPIFGKRPSGPSPEAEAEMERLVEELSEYKMGVLALLMLSFKLHKEDNLEDSGVISKAMHGLGVPAETIKEVGELFAKILRLEHQ